ncbi:MAG TPA: PadR family transcriptional regulator [Solirubrobacteraceae bacterium]|nr:PadR family transcriptional regulator [Solirubrobacteraceae bacterium]
MSATRLLLLGAVRIFQPVHGYFVRRELLSWHVDAWAHLNPGSVYNGLRSLAREGFVEEVGTETEGGRPARTTYRLTADGEAEFVLLLRAMLWNVQPHDPDDLMAAWAFAWALKREEVIAALEHRIEQIAASARATEFAIDGIEHSPGTPATVAEHFRLTQARLDGEAAWAREVNERLRAGEYWFEGEPDRPWSAPAVTGAEPGTG